MQHINRVRIESVLKQQERQYEVTFTKKDGSKRKMFCLNNVPSNGGRNTVVHDDNAYMTVFDTEKKEFRTINLATVTRIKTSEGRTWKVI